MLEVLRTLAAPYGALTAAYRAALVEPDLVEPTARFFPDAFALDGESVLRMLRRAMTYAPLGDHVAVELGVVEAEDESAGGGCGSGACGVGGPRAGGVVSGALVDRGEAGYGFVLHAKDAGDPVVLATAIARGVGGLVLAEAGEAPDPARAELSAAVCGFGVLLLNGASVYKKGCGGLREHKATLHSVEELAVATALFCALHGASPRAVRRHLAVTQAEAWDEAWRVVADNDELVAQLRAAPDLVAAGAFEVRGPRGLLGRLFGGRRADAPEPRAAAAKAPRARTADEERRLAEARALVDQALKG